MVHHFRYLITWTDERLRNSLPNTPGRLPRFLQNLPVVVVYLYQEQTGGKWEPVTTSSDGSYLPLRCGRLIDAFLEGEIAHFYFELTDYVKPTIRKQSPRALLKQHIRFRINPSKNSPLSYAHMAKNLDLGAPVRSDAFAFQRFVASAYKPGEWRTRSLGSAPLDVIYDVVFLRIAGIFHERDNRLIPVKPVRRPLLGNPIAEYELELGSTYHIQVATRLRAPFPAQLPGQGNALLRLVYDSNVFRPVGPTGFRISSTYDLHYWSILAAGSQPQRTVVSIACDFNPSVDRRNFVRKELLCPELSLAVSIVAPVSGRFRSRP
jgi:hypothetical protein